MKIEAKQGWGQAGADEGKFRRRAEEVRERTASEIKVVELLNAGWLSCSRLLRKGGIVLE